MRLLAALKRRFLSLFRRAQTEDSLRDELQFHYDHLVEHHIAGGATFSEARRQARLELGSLPQLQEECRDSWGVRALDEVTRDLRLALRSMAVRPGFTSVIVATLALGIGVNTAIFSLADAVLLESLPVPNAKELILLKRQDTVNERPPTPSFSLPLFDGLRSTEGVDLFAASFGYETEVAFEGAESPERVRLQGVTKEFFPVLGLQPQLGRLLGVGEEVRRGAYPYAVISDRLFRERFGSDRNVVGTSVRVNNAALTIIGVGPYGFEGVTPGAGADIWAPIEMWEQIEPGSEVLLSSYGGVWLTVMGRRAPGVGEDSAAAALQLSYSRIEESLEAEGSPDARHLANRVLIAEPGRLGVDVFRQQYVKPLNVLMGVAILIWALSCANVAALFLIRASQRGHETSLRAALGAPRARLVRQWLAESFLLAALGGVAGVLLARLAAPALVYVASTGGNYLTLDLSMDWRLLTIALTATALTAVAFGVGPALAASAARFRTTPGTVGARSIESGGYRRARTVLVGAQVAVSVVLTIAAGLMLQTVSNLRSADAGYETGNTWSLRIPVSQAGYEVPRGDQAPDEERQRAGARLQALVGQLRERLLATPGVGGATTTACGFLADCISVPSTSVLVDGNEIDVGRVREEVVGNGFVDTMGGHLLAGREFDAGDQADGPRVVIINETAAKAFFEDSRALGRTFRWNKESDLMEVVGILEDINHDGPRQQVPPFVYFPSAQRPSDLLTVVVRPASGSAVSANALRKAVTEVDPRLNVQSITTYDERMDSHIRFELMLQRLVTAFGGLALLLTTVGLSGVLGYSVSQRTREIGVRMALGARRSAVVRIVIRQTATVVAAGLAAGLAAAWAASQLIESMLFEVQPNDLRIVAAAAFVAACTGLVAAFVPALRAANVQPATALRHE